MINKQELKYLIKDVICLEMEVDSIDYNINLNSIEIQYGGNSYDEPLFSFKDTLLSVEDVSFLDKILNAILTSENNFYGLRNTVKLLKIENVSYIKIIHFFISEQYLDHNFPLDKHGRVSFYAVKEQYRKYLEIPIVDILIESFFFNLGIPCKKKLKVFFTCDFDILNFWSELGVVGFIKRQIKSLVTFQFKKSYHEILSIINGNRSIKYNYFLNDDMFFFKQTSSIKIENIAFWLMLKSHPLDCENDFSNNSFKSFLEILIKKEVTFALHPNYISSSNKNVFEKQIYKFKKVFNYNPLKIRFHYLNCRFPDDFKQLESLGIKEDFTYSFPDFISFRGGRSKPIKLWNHRENKPYDAISWPLTIMDGTLYDYMKLDYTKALAISKKFILYSLALGSVCDLLWHNRSLYKYGFEKNYHPSLINDIKSYVIEIDNEINN